MTEHYKTWRTVIDAVYNSDILCKLVNARHKFLLETNHCGSFTLCRTPHKNVQNAFRISLLAGYPFSKSHMTFLECRLPNYVNISTFYATVV